MSSDHGAVVVDSGDRLAYATFLRSMRTPERCPPPTVPVPAVPDNGCDLSLSGSKLNYFTLFVREPLSSAPMLFQFSFLQDGLDSALKGSTVHVGPQPVYWPICSVSADWAIERMPSRRRKKGSDPVHHRFLLHFFQNEL